MGRVKMTFEGKYSLSRSRKCIKGAQQNSSSDLSLWSPIRGANWSSSSTAMSHAKDHRRVIKFCSKIRRSKRMCVCHNWNSSVIEHHKRKDCIVEDCYEESLELKKLTLLFNIGTGLLHN